MKTQTPRAAPRLRRILVPVDFSKPSLDAVSYALGVARQAGAQIVLLHVVEPLHAGMLMDTTDLQREIRRAAHERLNKLVAATREALPGVTGKLRPGSAVAEIISFARRAGAELIVMGTHGRTGWRRGFIGSVAERVVRHAPCPVLVIR